MLVKYPVGQPRVDGFCRLRIKFAVYASNRVIIGRILTRALGYVQLDFGSISSQFPSYPRIQTRPFLESPWLIPIFSSPRIIPLSTGRGSKLSFDSVSVPNSVRIWNRNCCGRKRVSVYEVASSGWDQGPSNFPSFQRLASSPVIGYRSLSQDRTRAGKSGS